MSTVAVRPAEVVAAFKYAARPKETLVACLVCGMPLPRIVRAIDRCGIVISVSRCSRCLLEMINPRLTAEGYAAFYRDVYRQVTAGESIAHGRELGRYVATMLSRAGITPAGSIVDVGGGSGAVAQGLQRACPDARVTVRDPNDDDLAQARAAGLVTEIGCLEDVTGQYDGALCVRALDHTRQPVEGLQQLRAAVKVGGWLYVDMVDVWRMRQHYGPGMFWKVDHPVYWTPPTFLRALKAAGWTVTSHHWVQMATVGRITANTYVAICRNERA